ncbi:MAG: flagellar hook-basal body complex protein [Candidatus Sericytochromatia bacterium]
MGDIRSSSRATLGSLNKWIETISGNLVGSVITGYKSTRINFSDSLVDIVRNGSRRANNLGGVNPAQVTNGGISVGSTTTDFRQGSLNQTGNNTDLAIQGNAFFTLADSSGKVVYTRDGSFNFDDKGYLVNKDGQTVLGLLDSTRVIPRSNLLVDIGVGPGISYTGGGPASFGGTTAISNGFYGYSDTAIRTYFPDPNTPGRDRVTINRYIPAGALNNTPGVAANMNLFTIGSAVINISLSATENRANRTSVENARTIARAFNALSTTSGIGVSVIVNKNAPDLATLVYSSAGRTITEESIPLPTNPASTNLGAIVLASDAGLTKVYRDNKNNTFYAMNSLMLSTSAQDYYPTPGDIISFDSTGSMINNSKGKDNISAPPVNTGIHVALTKFSNDNTMDINNKFN